MSEHILAWKSRSHTVLVHEKPQRETNHEANPGSTDPSKISSTASEMTDLQRTT